MKRTNRDLTPFSLSFLDCISCGFGAVILLFIISLGSERLIIVDIRETLQKLYQERMAELVGIRSQKKDLVRMLEQQQEIEEEKKDKMVRMQTTVEELVNQIKEKESGQKALLLEVEQIKEALDAREKEIDIPENKAEIPIGVPIASNYIIFVLDTSGSMRDPSGRIHKTVTDKILEALTVYPIVEGIQVLDADGNFIISSSRGKWLPDRPTTRIKINQAIRFYGHQTQSNPVPGIRKAILTFRSTAAADKKIGIYVFGDEFTQTAEKVLDRIDELNKPDENGVRPITINAVGFPHVIKQEFRTTRSGLKFANLMRELTYRHGGAFIGSQK